MTSIMMSSTNTWRKVKLSETCMPIARCGRRALRPERTIRMQVSECLNFFQVLVDDIKVDVILLLGEVEQCVHTLLLCRVTGFMTQCTLQKGPPRASGRGQSGHCASSAPLHLGYTAPHLAEPHPVVHTICFC
jgi:hypothetical protein